MNGVDRKMAAAPVATSATSMSQLVSARCALNTRRVPSETQSMAKLATRSLPVLATSTRSSLVPPTGRTKI